MERPVDDQASRSRSRGLYGQFGPFRPRGGGRTVPSDRFGAGRTRTLGKERRFMAEGGTPRDLARDERDVAGDRRDVVAKDRDVAGDCRDAAADKRDIAGGERDDAGKARDDAGGRRDVAGRERDDAAAD